jgi:phosphate transport system substrate-binding protein
MSVLPASLLRVLALVLLVTVAITAQTSPIQRTLQINGAGATFPYPIYAAWFAAYAKLKPEAQINYLSIGSGAGIQQLTDQIVFFGATDTPMIEDEIVEAPGRILHLPTVLGGVVPIYNLPGVKDELKFDGAVLADIYLGKIRNWSDPAIARLNEGVTLPPYDITVVARAESSGTSFIWTDYLTKVSQEWRRYFGPTKNLNLPIGISARGSEGVSAVVNQTPGTIGYVELGYAIRNKNVMGSVQNMEGEFVRASTDTIAAAATAAVARMPRDFRVSITNAPGKGVYPIASFTWLLLYERPRDRARSQIMVEFMRWALADGQKFAPALGYAPLPAEIVTLEMGALETIRVQ